MSLNVGTLQFDVSIDDGKLRSGLRDAAANVRRLASTADRAGDGLGTSFQSGTRAATADLDRLEAKSRSTFDGIGRHAKTALVGAAGAMAAMGTARLASFAGNFFKDSIDEAASLNETVSKTQQIFEDASAGVIKWSENSATALNMTQREALDAASFFGQYAYSAGKAGDEATGFAQNLVELAGDLSSFYDTNTEDVLDDIASALNGSAEPMRKYNVLLDDQVLKQRAATMGIYEGTGTLTQQQRVLAAHAELLSQTSKAQGDLERTSDSYSNQVRSLSKEWTQLKAKAGQALLPIATEYVAKLRAAMPALSNAVQANMPKIAAWLKQTSDTVQRSWPQMRQTLLNVMAAIRANWPTVVGLAAVLTSTLQTLAPVIKSVTDAFLAMPPGMQQAIVVSLMAGAAYQRFYAPLNLVAGALRIMPAVAGPAAAGVAATGGAAGKAAAQFAMLGKQIGVAALAWAAFAAGKTLLNAGDNAKLARDAGANEGDFIQSALMTTAVSSADLWDNLWGTNTKDTFKELANHRQDAARMAEYTRLKDSGQWRPDMAADLQAKYAHQYTTGPTVNVGTMNISANDPAAWQAEIDSLAATQSLRGY